MCRKSFNRIWVSSTASGLSYKGITTGIHLQRDYRGADSGSDGCRLLGGWHLHKFSHRLARLDFVDGHAVGVGAGHGRRRPRASGHVQSVQLFYQIIVLPHEIVQRIVLLQDLRVHAARRVRDPVRFPTDPALERPAAQRLRGRELEGAGGRRQG